MRPLQLIFAFLLLLFLVITPDVRAKGPQADAGGVTLVRPEKDLIAVDTSLSVSFPAAMVGAEKIDLAGESCPLRFDPAIPGDWLWKSQTDGQFVVKGPVLPGQKYGVTLAPGLKDLAGTAVAPAAWGAVLHTKAFEVHTTWEEDSSLPAKPGVVLQFTYPVRLQEVADRVYFQDRDSQARQAAELALREEDRDDDEPEAAVLRATPREPLPPGRTWDLVVEDVREQGSGQPTPYLKRIPLGTTAPLALSWLGAFNLPLEKPEIRAKFDDTLNPATVSRDAVQVEPAVPGLTVHADGQELVLEGNFDRAQHYRVTIQPSVRGEGGFGLPGPVTRGATFRPKASALFFPGSDFNQRARLGLRFSFLQVHTGPLRWRLASVPLEKLALVQKRLREWTQSKKNPISGEAEIDDAGQEVPQPTELLVDTLGLATSGEGTFPASPDETENLRDLRWSPPGGAGVPPGAYLLEIDGPRWDGKGVVGNRSLVYFSETVLTRKRTPETVLARLAGMADGLPRPGVPVRALSASNFEVAHATSGPDGVAEFAAATLTPPKGERGGEPAQTLVADTPEGPAVVRLDGDGLDETPTPEPPEKPLPPTIARGIVLTDRSLYRPGQTVKIKGLVRNVATKPEGAAGTPPTVPAGAKVFWTLRESDQDETLASGETVVDSEGGWAADWPIPGDLKLTDYVIRATVGAAAVPGEDEGASRPIRAVLIKVQDYKVPLFEVKAEAIAGGGDPQAPRATCRVRADYFSGQPVVGAKVAWRVHWDRRDFLSHRSGDEEDGDRTSDETNRETFQLDDRESEHAKTHDSDEAEPPETRGEGTLDAHGSADFVGTPPPNLPGVRYTARWEVAVTSADGQSVAAAKPPETTVMFQPVLLGVEVQTHQEATPDAGESGPPPGVLRVGVAAFDAEDHLARTTNVEVELFHVGNKTVRENVAPFVTRYHNVPRYDSVFTKTLAAVGPDQPSVDVPVKEPGRYVVVLTAPGLKPVSVETFNYRASEDDTDARDEVPVTTETSLVLRSEKKEYAPGETAAFLTRTPVTGVAWVSVETDRVLDQFLLPLPAKTSRLEIPVKPGYAPNARVAVYLLRPGGADTLPAERFATARLRVRRPDRVLDVRPTVAAASVRPGEAIHAEVRVLGEGKPVAGADVTLWAVDDAILALGEWKTPSLLDAFYPDRPFRVKTYAALRGFVESFSRKSLYEKGFIIGGGGEEFAAKFVRKVFQPLAYWQTGLKTDADGRVAVQFAAPDNLTRYRLIAVVQTRAGQFGEGEGSVEIAKPLMVEPSLPRFLRAGDEVELRAVLRQSVKDRVSVTATCAADAGVVFTNGDGKSDSKGVDVNRDAPMVVRFRAKVPDDGHTSAKIRFTAVGATHPDEALTDGAEITLPILPPTILRRESVVGAGRPGGDVVELLPEDARNPGAKGRYDVAISTSADLPRLQALPAVLEYPHGCFEQVTSRILVYCAAGKLFAGLPAQADADAARRRTVEQALGLCARGLLDDGTLPYWSGKVTNPFVTVQADWAAQLAAGAGFTVDDTMQSQLDQATDKLAANASTAPFVRALALFAQTGREAAAEQDAASTASTRSRPGFHPKKPAEGDSEADSATEADEDEESKPTPPAEKPKAVAAGFNEQAAREIFLRRETLGDDGRAILAVALHRAKVMPDEKAQLLREILPLARATRPVPERAFDTTSFGSSRRTAAVAVWACAEIRPPEWKPADSDAARARLGKLLDDATRRSTQENLWSLLAFDAVHKADRAPKLRVAKARPAPDLLSPDGTAATWTGLILGDGVPLFRPPPDLALAANAPLTCVLAAQYRVGKAEEDTRRDRGGMRVERVVRNLTDPKRTGRAGEPPVRINDRLLVTYRMQTPKPRAYVALEDELPAGLEAINPDLPLFAPFYDLPPAPPGEQVADLSFSELHDNVTRLYFDRLAPGVSTDGVLVRATAAGTFRWPATQAGPMYEPEVSGLAPSGELTVESEP